MANTVTETGTRRVHRHGRLRRLDPGERLLHPADLQRLHRLGSRPPRAGCRLATGDHGARVETPRHHTPRDAARRRGRLAAGSAFFAPRPRDGGRGDAAPQGEPQHRCADGPRAGPGHAGFPRRPRPSRRDAARRTPPPCFLRLRTTLTTFRLRALKRASRNPGTAMTGSDSETRGLRLRSWDRPDSGVPEVRAAARQAERTLFS